MFGQKNLTEIKPLKIMIVGCGKVGIALIEQLSKEGNEITIVDKDHDIIDKLTNTYDIIGYHGNGASYGVLTEAGIEDMDLFIAVTESDEMNLLCCTIAGRITECSTIARVRDPDISREIGYLRERLGLTMIINPEFEAARETAKILYLPAALEVNTFAHGQAEIIKFKVEAGSILDGVTIAEFSSRNNNAVLFCAVERGEEVSIPTGFFRFKAGDVVSFVAPRRGNRARLKLLNLATPQVHNCLIVGGSESAFYLAKELLQNKISVTLIEKEKKRCEELAEELDGANIINGDGTDEELLKEEGLESVDSFIPLTGIDEENVMLTLHARKVSDAKVVTKINRFAFKDVTDNLNLGSVIYPMVITSEAIIAYARAKRASLDSNIESLYHMYDGRVEAIEFLIRNESPVTGTPIMKLPLKKNVLITCISRNGNLIFPGGSDTLEVGDTVMIVTKNFGFQDIHDILDSSNGRE
jgi:trk system potassium uptake protein TrkA